MVFKKVFTIQTSNENQTKKPNNFGVRHVQSILIFFGMVFGYFLRVNISAAIVPMTQIPSDDNYNGLPYFSWDSKTKSLILSSFFWGYVVAQVPSGILAKRYGGKIVLGIATIFAAILSIFHPLATIHGDWQVLCVFRVLTGITQGVVYPCVHTLLAKWVPSTERSFLSTAIYSGAQIGTALILATSGLIFDAMDWSGIFYISGGVSLIWAIVFLIFGSDAPATSRVISPKEREYIENLTDGGTKNENLSIPWKSIFTSLPFYGLIAAHCGFTWGFYTLLTEIPTYMSKVLQLNVRSNGLLSALPYFTMWILCFCVSPISDMLINSNIISITFGRKLFNTIGQWIPMGCLIALGYMTKDEKTAAIALLTIAVGFNAFSYCGYLVNHMDLSPNFAGPMMGVTNGLAGLTSIFAPLIVGSIVKDENEPSEWRIVFLITAGVYLVCNLLFILIGKATVQPWNNPPTSITRDLNGISNNIEIDIKSETGPYDKESKYDQ